MAPRRHGGGEQISTVDSTQATLEDLRADMAQLDEALAGAVAQAQRLFGAGTDDRRFAGLVITHDEPERLLSRPLGDVAFGRHTAFGAIQWRTRGLTRAARACELTDFDAAVLLLAIAPELDLRYERIYAYLQDDVTRRRPTVALALDLFIEEPGDKLALRSRFLPGAPLRRHGLVELVADPHPAPPPLLAHGMRPSDGVVRFLLGEPALDPSSMHCCRLEPLVDPDGDNNPRLPNDVRRRLTILGTGADAHERKPVVLIDGGDRVQCHEAACAVARAARRPLLTVRLDAMDEGEAKGVAMAARCAAALHDAVIHLAGADGAAGPQDAAALLDGTVPVVAGLAFARSVGHHDHADVRLHIPRADFARRRELFASAIGATGRGEAIAASIADSLARRFRLSPDAIDQVVQAATGMARWRAAASDETPDATLAEFMEAARDATRGQLDGLARRITPQRDRGQLILPPDRFELLNAIRAQVEFGPIVSEQWGFARAMSPGIVALFSGPPGTGKTLAAEVLAGELSLDLYAIDLSQVVSKYIGETEKNLARVFEAAENSSAILFFDEADALFGARSEVRDAHDRYANIEVGYLLQRMEQYSGLAVLASNLPRNIDEAFLRRMRFVITFPLPDAESRRRIWEATWPRDAPSSDLDFNHLAARFDVSGATIRDAAVGAAFLAAVDGGAATMAHVGEAMSREYAKLGRLPVDPSQGMSSRQSSTTRRGASSA